MAKLVILDRDGVINVYREHGVRNPGDLELLPGSATAIARLNRAGIAVAMATNQSIIGRGVIGEDELTAIHRYLFDLLAREDAHIDLACVCCDPPDATSARHKPGPAMLDEAMRCLGATSSETIVIGDGLDDIEAAASAGCARILVRTGTGARVQAAGIPDWVLPISVHVDLAAAVAAILGDHGLKTDVA